MSLLKRILVMMVILSVLGIHFPNACFALNERYGQARTPKTITKHPPEVKSIPEIQSTGKSNWLWLLLGVVAIGALAGGGGGGGGGGEPPPPDYGNITIQWNE